MSRLLIMRLIVLQVYPLPLPLRLHLPLNDPSPSPAPDQVTGALTVQSMFRGNRDREITEAYFNRVA